tara:strand:+ start:43129 stop:45639 length:2511 start_codon:yes stop_codon:yes gene_type:complete
MKKIIPILFFISNIFILSQNHASNAWGGLSVSLSDNLDAINLNPAGLGVDRGNQSGINIQQVNFNSQHSNYHVYSLINRWHCGWAIQNNYDETNKYQWTIGYGTKIANKLYSGFTLNKSKNYSFGMLYRYSNAISSGFTLFSNKENTFRDIRYGIAIRPINLFKKNKHNNKFLNYSNLTIGYDKVVNYNDNWVEEDFKEYFFMNFNIVNGVNIGFKKSQNSNYAISLSLNLGNKGFSLNNYPSESTNSIAANGFGFYSYSQKQKTDINLVNWVNDNYVYLELEGVFIEEKPKKTFFNFEIDFSLFGTEDNLDGIQLREFIEKIDEITNKKNIKGIIIKMGTIQAGFGKRKEIYNAFMELKNAGKEIIVYSDRYEINQYDYYLISMADKIFTSSHTAVDLKGINMEMMFLRGLLDTIYVVPEVLRVSPYKSAGDILLNKKMSEEVKENYGQLLDDFYSIMVTDISVAKNWDTEETKTIINNGPYYSNKKALKLNLITKTMYPDEFKDFLDSDDHNIINWSDIQSNDYYIHDWTPEEAPKIAIIYAVGGIMSGESNPGPRGSSIMGDKTITEAIKQARENKNIKAIVLRIDSGGGSVLASDMIWREIHKTVDDKSKNNKPVIVSMSDVAASGGYYIGCEADKIIADPTTITGSIGVIWVRLNFSNLLKKIGISFDGIKSNSNADFASSSHLLNDKEKEKILNVINEEYNDFKQKVIDGRPNLNDIDSLDDIALGRIWSGKRAKELGLIDEIGGLFDAIELAKINAGIELNENINIEEFPKQNSFSLFNFLSEEKSISTLELDDVFPQDMSEKLETLDLLPVIMDNELQLLMPYKIILD